MSKELMSELAMLEEERNFVLRQLDIYYFDKKRRQTNFERLKEIDKEISKVKFKSKAEKELKNANNNTNKSNN